MPLQFVMLATFGSMGALFLLLAIILYIKDKQKRNRCTQMTRGRVTHYSFLNDFPAPVLEYFVNGERYTKKKRFRGIITVSVPGFLPFGNKKPRVYIDEKDVVHIRRGAYLNLKEEAERLYPLGQELPVFYNPEKPKQAYVEKIPLKRPVEILVFFLIGAVFCILGIVLCCVL